MAKGENQRKTKNLRSYVVNQLGKGYKRLVKMVADWEETDRISVLIKVYN